MWKLHNSFIYEVLCVLLSSVVNYSAKINKKEREVSKLPTLLSLFYILLIKNDYSYNGTYSTNASIAS